MAASESKPDEAVGTEAVGTEAVGTEAVATEAAQTGVAVAERNGTAGDAGTARRLAAGAPAGGTPAGGEDIYKGEKAGALVMAARLALRKGQKEEARARLQQAFVLSPTDAGALELLGDIFLEEGEQDKAIQVFERGLKYHPRHHAFEEKIALAHLDLAEMERDKLLKQELLESGDRENWMDRRPSVALGLSVLFPGAGQFYNGDTVRGIAFVAGVVVTFSGWFFPLTAGIKQQTAAGTRSLDVAFGAAMAAMSGPLKFVVLFMFLAWIATYILSGLEAAVGAERINTERKRSLGLM